MYSGKIRSFLKCFKCTHLESKCHTVNEESKTILGKYFGIPDFRATAIAKKTRIKVEDEEELKETIRLLTNLGYDGKDVAQYPRLFLESPRIVEVHYLVFKEAGFTNISLDTLSHFRKCAHRKISTLKMLQYIPENVNVPQSLVSHLKPKPTNLDISDFTDNDLFSQVHSTIVKRYLVWRLEATKEEIDTLFRIYHYLKFKSLNYLCESIDLAIEVGFTPRKILKFGYLLDMHPPYPLEVLKTMPNLAGANMRVAMRRYPKLLTIPPRKIIQIHNILKEANVSDEAIQKSMNIFTLAPKTVKLRLEEISSIPELKVLKNNPRMLRLIIHHHRARSRLTFLQEVQLKCASLVILGSDGTTFEDHLRLGRDVNVLKDITNMLTPLLKCDANVIMYELKKHPYHLHVPLVNIEQTTLHLQKNFSNSSIIKVLPIVLYPIEKIEKALKSISEDEKLSRRLSKSKKLNLALYFIEKECHFTGNGVWASDKELE